MHHSLSSLSSVTKNYTNRFDKYQVLIKGYLLFSLAYMPSFRKTEIQISIWLISRNGATVHESNRCSIVLKEYSHCLEVETETLLYS